MDVGNAGDSFRRSGYFDHRPIAGIDVDALFWQVLAGPPPTWYERLATKAGHYTPAAFVLFQLGVGGLGGLGASAEDTAIEEGAASRGFGAVRTGEQAAIERTKFAAGELIANAPAPAVAASPQVEVASASSASEATAPTAPITSSEALRPVDIPQPLTGDEPRQYLYRGVHAGHPRMSYALRGIVVPGRPLGNLSTAAHNAGGFEHLSPYTSWTDDFEYARQMADRNGPGGIVLRVPIGAAPPNAAWYWEWSEDEFMERERLLHGIRRGAEVIK
jgi:hypothetical protein